MSEKQSEKIQMDSACDQRLNEQDALLNAKNANALKDLANRFKDAT